MIRPLRVICLLLPTLLSLAPAVHAAEAPALQYVPVATLPLRGPPPNSLRPLVDGAINGRPALMLISTGVSYSTLTKDAAEKFGIGLGRNSRNSLVSAAPR